MSPDASSRNATWTVAFLSSWFHILLHLQISMSASYGDARRVASTRLGPSPAPVVMDSISLEMGPPALVSWGFNSCRWPHIDELHLSFQAIAKFNLDSMLMCSWSRSYHHVISHVTITYHCLASLVPRLCVPPGEKRSGERSQFLGLITQNG